MVGFRLVHFKFVLLASSINRDGNYYLELIKL